MSDAGTSSPQEKRRRDEQPRSRIGGCLSTFGWLVLLLVLGLVAARPLLKFFVFRKDMSPAVAAQIDKWQEEPLKFPSSWLDPVTYSPRTLALADEWTTRTTDFHRTTVSLALRTPAFSDEFLAHYIGGSISENNTTFTQLVLAADEMVRATSETVHQPDYEMGVRFGGHMYSSGLGFDGLAIVSATTASLHAQRGEYTRAMDYALLILERCKSRPAASIYNRLLSTAAISLGGDLLGRVALETSDTKAVNLALTRMLAMREEVVPDLLGLPYATLEAIGALAHTRGLDPSIRVRHGETTYYYYRRYLSEALERKRTAGPHAPSKAQIELLLTLSDVFAPDMFIIPKIRDYEGQAQAAEALSPRVQYDLAVLALAQRAAELEGRSVSSQADLAPQYIPHNFSDAGGKPYPFDATRGRFFGPVPASKTGTHSLPADETSSEVLKQALEVLNR